MAEFEKRRIGRSTLEVTVFGLGCATLGGRRVKVTREEAEAIVHAAWAEGVRYIDAAPYYGFGQAERVVGDALRDKPRNAWVLSTKVGRLLRPLPDPAAVGHQHPMPFTAVFDYSYEGVMRSFEDSLQRLGLGRIDILYVHDIGAMEHGGEAHPRLMRELREGGYRALEELRRTGTIGAIGMGEWDAFLLAGRYTLLEQAPLDDLFPACARRGVSIVVGGPFNSGVLAGRETFNYAPAPPEVLARVQAIRAVCESYGVPIAAAALQFPLAHPVVAAVIPGPRNVDEFETNVKLLAHPIPAALWADLRAAGLLHPEAPTPPDGVAPVTLDTP
jgi:D-threo-aldose 1-dehydrogenase